MSVFDDGKKTIATVNDVVKEKFDAVDAADGKNCITLPAVTKSLLSFVDGKQLSYQDRSEKVAVATGGLQKSRVDAFAFMRDEVEHVVDQFRRGEDLTVGDDALT